jgi:phosphotransferase system HPr (HPr) family protein
MNDPVFALGATGEAMTRPLAESDSMEQQLPGTEAGVNDATTSPTDDLSSRTEATMTGPTLRCTVRITNPLGFHMRPKGEFAKLACQFESIVKVSWQGRTGNGKSMWDLMLVSAPEGDEVTVEVVGPDARQALEALAALLAAPSLDEDAEVGLAENI